MRAPEMMWRFLDDSTTKVLGMDVNVTESNNIEATDLGLNLDPQYTLTQVARTWDFRDDLQGNTAPFDGVGGSMSRWTLIPFSVANAS